MRQLLVCQIVVHVKCLTYIVFSLCNGYIVITQTSRCAVLASVKALPRSADKNHLCVVDVQLIISSS